MHIKGLGLTFLVLSLETISPQLIKSDVGKFSSELGLMPVQSIYLARRVNSKRGKPDYHGIIANLPP